MNGPVWEEMQKHGHTVYYHVVEAAGFKHAMHLIFMQNQLNNKLQPEQNNMYLYDLF